MASKEDVINSSTLIKHRKLRLKDTGILNLLISKTVFIAVEKGIIRSKSIIVDVIHTLSRSSPISAIKEFLFPIIFISLLILMLI